MYAHCWTYSDSYSTVALHFVCILRCSRSGFGDEGGFLPTLHQQDLPKHQCYGNLDPFSWPTPGVLHSGWFCPPRGHLALSAVKSGCHN